MVQHDFAMFNRGPRSLLARRGMARPIEHDFAVNVLPIRFYCCTLVITCKKQLSLGMHGVAPRFYCLALLNLAYASPSMVSYDVHIDMLVYISY